MSESTANAGTEQASTYCVYIAGSSSTKLQPAINANDTVCIDCPGGGKCRGQVNREMQQLVKDGNGNQERIKLTLRSRTCQDCPAAGRKGYSFGPVAGDTY